MGRFLSLSLLVPLILLTPSAVRAADDDPVLQFKRLSEWIELLRGEQGQTTRQTLLQALGCAASHPKVWHSWLLQRREAGLLAVSLIGPQKSPNVFPALLGALRNDPEENIRRGAALSLGRLGKKVHDDNKEMRGTSIKLTEVRNGLVEALRADKSPKVREACARSLGQLQEDATEAIPALVHALKDADENTQAAAGEALRVLGLTITIRDKLPELEEALKNPKTNTLARVQIAVTLGLIGRSVAVDNRGLREVLKDAKTPGELRVAVAETLGTLGSSSAVEDLTAVLAAKDSSQALRHACLVALDSFGTDAKPALPELKKGLNDKDKFIRTQSMHVIGRIGKELGPESKEIVKELLKITNDPIFEVRLAAIETLGNLGAEAMSDALPMVLERLTELAKDGQRTIRDAAEDAKKKLKPAP
jgi:HEAT repeat protein